MFDREKQVVINRICKTIFSEVEKISVSDLLNLNIPEAVKFFIVQEIGNRIDKEFNEFKKYTNFDFDSYKVKPLVDELKVLLKFDRKLNLEELSILLKLALDLNLDYLLKPFDTLSSFVFKYEEYQSTEIIKDRLKFVTMHQYFPILINEYFKRTGLTKISKSDFINLLYKIEHEYTKDFTILDHYNLFSAFKNFLLELNLFINDYPEYEAFIIYLQDKKHIKLAQFLEEHKDEFKSFGGNVLSYLESLMHPVITETKQEKRIETESKEIASEFNQTELVEEYSNKDDLDNIEKNDTGFGYTIAAKNTKDEKNELVSKEISNLAEDEIKKSELFQKLTSTQIIKKEKQFDRNLDRLMPARLRKKIIKKIFDDNQIVFNEFMNNVNKVENWDEASLLLTDLFDKRNIQPFSKWAIKFTEFLYENIK